MEVRQAETKNERHRQRWKEIGQERLVSGQKTGTETWTTIYAADDFMSHNKYSSQIHRTFLSFLADNESHPPPRARSYSKAAS